MSKFQPGQMLGAYRIVSQIGVGGMATVYKAYQSSMDRNVAIKVLPQQLAESEEFVKRFQQEARIIANLEHPYILPVFDYGEEDGTAYFVMRYLEAGTLKEKMSAGQLSLDEIDHIFTQLTDALGYAHAHKVVHRDLKPANVLVDLNGNLFLTDFGIAKLLESASPRLTQTAAMMGTPAYISPEQVGGLSVDQRSDIYSLGVILYEMVTGSVPFVADTPLAVILKHLNEPLPLPSIIKPDISPFIEQVIVQSLAKDPSDRFNSTGEFVLAWRSALNDMQAMERKSGKSFDSTPLQNISHVQPPSKPQTISRSGRPAINVAIGCALILCLATMAVGVIGFAARFLNPPSSVLATDTPTIFVDSPSIILEDGFSAAKGNWGTVSDSNSLVQYDADTLRMIIYTRNWFVWSTPDSIVYRNVHLETTVINNDTDQHTAFGLMCNQQNDGLSFYYFAITPDGQYVIARTDSGAIDGFLTNSKQWGYSNLIARNASSYRVGADCGNGNLTLYVDGREIDSVADSVYTSGRVGVVVRSAVDATKTDISFDDFLVTNIP